MEHLIGLKAVFVISSSAGAFRLVRLSLAESRKSFERWAGLLAGGLFGLMAISEAARLLTMLRGA